MTSIFELELSFDENKPFCSLIINHVAQVHGFLDLASRGLLSELEEIGPKGVEMLLAAEGHKEKGFNEAVEAISKGGRTGLVGKQQLESKVTGKGITINVESLAKEIFNKHKAPLDQMNRMSAGSLLILAYESTRTYQTQDSLWEFLRHCRNAAAHKGYFNFLHGEPKRPAKWRGLEIISSMQGEPLFNEPPVSGFLGNGDILYLLWDIEQAFPNITS
jgi:hypothetical protein